MLIMMLEESRKKARQTNMTLMQDKYPAFLYRVCFRVMFVYPACPAFPVLLFPIASTAYQLHRKPTGDQA
jgi:hypothetical protein